ncbi:transglycosylase SLT domain-containing protein [Flavonifractor plautii]|uniref:Transglycosylase SLT domain-containing protein n=1 Tax=Flavonifractor plautii TaxID=292800 RepID=A0AAW6CJV5_FLAPL|nr:transglycosylase SLT domain-containing protein [Flavonifractor plautii]MDB7929630.1 transglycosylase SLT domain-containing protein [Flavonifractor plautii]MDB7934466.1 transglycosylase SLT domain-containing protein [Flavonifractor plautii]MDB7939451.1 transglycosylase SLT domain-containing protein [Flavonifractor plautii]
MSQRKAKEYRRAMEQYRGVVEDVDDLKRRIGAMEARHRREDQLEEIRRRQARREAEQWEKKRKESMEQARKIRAEERRRQISRRRINALAAGVLVVALLLALAIRAMTADTAAAEEPEIINASPVAVLTMPPDTWSGEGEAPLEAEKIEEALLASGYFSLAVPMCYEYQDYMRTYCEAYGCPYPLALAVAETESRFDMEAVGAAGEVGIMQLNPGPSGSYHAELEEVTGLDPTTPSGNIAAGCYLLGKYMADYKDPHKAAMAYNMGVAGARNAWEAGITSTDYSAAVVEAMELWEVTVNAWNGT